MGIFGFGGRKKAVDTPPRYIEVRSYSGPAFHILDQGMNPARVLCGYENWVPTNTTQVVSIEKIVDSIPNQHENWWWCPTCANILTGRPMKDFGPHSWPL
jgi:hypothetical protein